MTKPESQSLTPQFRKYTQDQIQFILEARLSQELDYGEIASKFAKKYGGERTADQMRHAFRSYASTAVLDKEGHVTTHPFTGFTHANFVGTLKAASRPRGRWFITAASPVSNVSTIKKKQGRDIGYNLFMPGFKAIQTWCKAKGDLIVLPMRAHMPPLHGQPSYYDPFLQDFEQVFANEFYFNENLRALDVYLNPQQPHPLTGLHRIRGTKSEIVVKDQVIESGFHQSLIFAHSKQDMEPVATGNGSIARYLWSTGAITLPEYRIERIGRVAHDDHILGGLIVEMDGLDTWVRPIQFAPDGSFCDIDGKRYRADGKIVSVRAKALRIGDLHGGRENPEVIDTHVRLAEITRPEEVYLDDVFDGSSCSHHTEKSRVTRAMRPPWFKSIEAETAYDCRLLTVLKKRFGASIIIAQSNHHDHLVRYLEEGRYHTDDPNFAIAHRMVVEILDGIDPLRKRLDPNNEYEWLGSETDRYVEGVQMASHGHLGVDGVRASPAHLERTFGNAIVGHNHAARILGRLYVVGHSSYPRHGYNKGPSRWSYAPGFVWPGGQKQLVMYVDGRFGLDDKGARCSGKRTTRGN